MKRKLEKLCNDFSNVSQLLSVMEKGAWECANLTNCIDEENKTANLFREISYSLAFVSDTLKEKSESFFAIIEDIAE